MVEIGFTVERATQAELGVHFDTLKEKIPAWLYKASPTLRQAFREHLLALETARDEVQSVLAALQSVEKFCQPLLVQALENYHNGGVDLPASQFVRIDATYLSSLFGDKVYTFVHSQTLLEAALQNFEASEAVPGALSGKSILRSPRQALDPRLSLAPEAFARICRTLDLGRLYQNHIDSVFNPPSPPHAATTRSVKACFVDYYKRMLTVHADLAHLTGDISAEIRDLLLGLVNGHPDLMLQGKPVHCSRMRILDIESSGWVVIGAGLTDRSEQPCIAYIPGDPDGSLKYYSRFLFFEHALTLKLRKPSYREFFSRFIPEEHRVRFLHDLAGQLLPEQRGWPPLPPLAQYLELREIPVGGDLFEDFHQQRYQQIKRHARQLVVPTAYVDARLRQARLDSYREAGLNLLVLALSFVPVVGEVIMAVSVVQLLKEAYTGLHAWNVGERHDAIVYLMDVTENVAMLVAGSVALSAGRALLKSIKAPASVDALLPVEVDGQRRLWKADLAPYERDITLPPERVLNEQGLYTFEGRHYLPLENRLYEVAHDSARLRWQIEHPGGAGFHAPALRHNGIGTWQGLHERPAEWSGKQLLRRLGRPVVGLGENRLRQVWQLHGAAEDALRQTLVDNQRAPALLLDTLKRFRIEQSIELFINEAPTLRVRTPEQGDLRLRLLTSLPDWPENHVVQLFGAQGELLEEYGQRTAPQFSSLRLSEAQLSSGDSLELPIGMLSASERRAILGADLTDDAERLRVLEQRLQQSAAQRRQWLFDTLYAASERSDDARVRRMLESFPSLPVSAAEEIIANGRSAELELLNERIPLRFSEEAAWFIKQVKLNRACESWYMTSPADPQADQLALQTLGRLRGWSKDLRIELRKQRIISDLVAAVGPEHASTLRLLLKVGHRYTAIDSSGTILGAAQNLFDALVFALPQPVRETLGSGVKIDGNWLKEQLVEQIGRDPEAAQRALGMVPFNRRFHPPMRLASGRIGYPLSNRSEIIDHTEQLVHRVQALYPGLSGDEVSRFITSLDLSAPACLVELERRRAEYESLSSTLDNWVQRPTWRRVRGTLQVAPVVMDNKRRVAEAILACWRRQTPSSLFEGRLFYEMNLLGMRVGDLPPITADFSHVGFLFMNDMGVSLTELSFLGHFRQLRWLSLGFNQLDALPSALTQMPELVHLHLQGNQIVMNAQTSSLLARLTRLKFLNLSDNPLGLPPYVGAMPDLEHLLLRHTRIEHWPDDLARLSRLQRVDLRDNRIATIPESVYQNPVAINRAIHLHDNPTLSPADMSRLQRYEQETGINFGIDTPTRRRVRLMHRTPSLQEYDRWVEGVPAGLGTEKEQQWRLLFRQQGAGDFFRVLADLAATAEYREARQALSQRVWQVLDAASRHSGLREELFVAGGHPQTCSDGVELVFSDMEVKTLVSQARGMAEGRPETVELNLLKLSRGLWRLDEVETLAQADVEARLKVPGAHVDPLEVRLAYRIGLAERLGLPGQPAYMTFTEMAQVTPQDLDAVYAKVLAREKTPAYVRSLAAREFWGDYLQERYPERFEAISTQHQEAVEVLDAQRTEHHDPAWHEFINVELETQMGEQLKAWREARRVELERLTEEILVKTPEADLE
ncbi:C-terminal novel E3 ligase, LRR-interacting [Pseudomonas asplenii]|uniref:RING-type E3 ubiquitin transferase n=1 Tax=Pseudomonas asplenii TaxID=53407 RepID=A0A1H1YJ40_9PSED|nr:NEL-type E3 ubiquitin ligase domain-containing protein [Pseudomonas asplenii]SDT21381.1 C-terminal novel E3 ligase, LRR-interacting [Pseudomonas asplenii]